VSEASLAFFVSLDEPIIPVNGCQGKRGHTNRDVFRAFGSAVLNPFASLGDDRLAGVHIKRSTFVIDVYGALENDGVFIKLGRLPWLGPAGGTPHVSDADLLSRCGNSTYELID
jgi:hypothetical protein